MSPDNYQDTNTQSAESELGKTEKDVLPSQDPDADKKPNQKTLSRRESVSHTSDELLKQTDKAPEAGAEPREASKLSYN